MFASAQPVSFVGLENYRNLLGLTIKKLPPKIDETTGEPLINPDTGEIEYESAVSVLPREPLRFRELTQFNLFGTHFVIGASDRDFIRSIGDTLAFVVSTVILELILGMGIALVVNTKFPGRGAMRAVMLVPWAIPTAVSSRMWEYMLNPTRTGVINVIIQQLGLGNGQIPFLVDPAYQLYAMIIIDVWKTTSFMALLLLAGLQLIPDELYEAASVDGASKLRRFFSITLPMLKPTIAVALVFRTLDAVRVFDLFQIVLQKRRFSMASFAYYELIDGQTMGYSSAASVIIFLVITIFAIWYIRMLGVRQQ
jgi:trehalose/maltose transport system permease protein